MQNKIIISPKGNEGKNNAVHHSGIEHDSSSGVVSTLNDARSGGKAGAGIDLSVLDENVWGNDRIIKDNIDKELLAERRLFVRVRHMQKLTCSLEYEDIDKEPVELGEPLEFMTVDLSAAGIGILSEQEIDKGKLLGIRMMLDDIPYDIVCEVVYCIRIDDKFRAGLKIARRNKQFMRHLKIFVARTSLTSQYASGL